MVRYFDNRKVLPKGILYLLSLTNNTSWRGQIAPQPRRERHLTARHHGGQGSVIRPVEAAEVCDGARIRQAAFRARHHETFTRGAMTQSTILWWKPAHINRWLMWRSQKEILVKKERCRDRETCLRQWYGRCMRIAVALWHTYVLAHYNIGSIPGGLTLAIPICRFSIDSI